jgi:hypothetical protein
LSFKRTVKPGSVDPERLYVAEAVIVVSSSGTTRRRGEWAGSCAEADTRARKTASITIRSINIPENQQTFSLTRPREITLVSGINTILVSPGPKPS